MSFAIIIPAQEKNKYHELGDLAPFGSTTLLEWKIAQCKEFAELSEIHISSDSDTIKDIAKKEEVNFIKRKSGLSYKDMVFASIEGVNANDIVLINTTSPFMKSEIYKKMYTEYKNEKLISLISVEKKKEYFFYNKDKLNFSDNFVSRETVDPVYIVTNGCYIIKKDLALDHQNILSSSPSFFEVDSFAATEIKDVKDYKLAREMITIFFQDDLNV